MFKNTTKTGTEEKEIESNIEGRNGKVTTSQGNNEFDKIWSLKSVFQSQQKIVSSSGNLENNTYMFFCFVDKFDVLHL